MLPVTEPVPSLVGPGFDGASLVGASLAGTGLDRASLAGAGFGLGRPATDLTRLAALLPERDLLPGYNRLFEYDRLPGYDRLRERDLLPGRDPLGGRHEPAGAPAEPGVTSALTAEIVRSVVASVVAAVTLMERPVAGGRAAAARLSLASPPARPVDGQMCAVVAVDIVGFTRADRDDDIRRHLHKRLYEYLEEAFDSCGISWDECFWEDRGDGALIVVPPELPVKVLIDPLPDKLRRLIRLHNHVSAAAADMQLRVAAHIGPVEHDGHGFVGTDVNFAFRMLDARPLKAKLAESHAELGLIVSDDVYDKLICRCPSLTDPGAFQAVRFQTKNTRARAWTHLPGTAA
jgi:hypothetical protein